jgi:hypothetical protein
MRGDPYAYEAYYPVGFWTPGPVIKMALLTATVLSIGPGWDRLIAAATLWALLFLSWACMRRSRRLVALRVSSAGITLREREGEKRTATVRWNDVGYLVIWHDGRATSLCVQPPGGNATADAPRPDDAC